MKVIRNSRNLFTTSIVLDHWVNNKKRVKKLMTLQKKRGTNGSYKKIQISF